MKKILVLFGVMVMVFGFSAAAFAVTCPQCKCDLRDIPCPTATQAGGPACVGFDYDLHTLLDGYCIPGVATSKCGLIFPICDCAQAAWFVPTKNVGLKMTILVDGVSGDRGAYWSGTGVPGAMTFANAATANAACALVPPLAKSFGAPNFWASDGTTVILAGALTTDTTCTVPVGARSTILTTSAGYVIVPGDAGLAYWKIDVPPIRIDPAVIASGSKISVKAELYDATAIAGVCPACVGCLCDCTIEVAVVCCAGPAIAPLSFPYFADLGNTLGWWNGIAINNPTAAAGSCTLTAVEMNGAISTATVAVPAGGMYVNYLENLTFVGATGGMPARITAVCDYAGATGFAMMADRSTSDSMGYRVP